MATPRSPSRVGAPRLHRQRSGQQPEPALRTQAGHATAAENRTAEVERARPAGAALPRNRSTCGSPLGCPARPSGRPTTALPRSIGATYARIASSRGSRSPIGRPSATATMMLPRLRAGLGPEAPHPRAPQDPHRQVEIAVRGDRLGQPGQLDRARRCHRASRRRSCSGSRSPAPLLRGELRQRRPLAQQPLDDVRPAGLDREIGRPQQPLGPPVRRFAEPRRPVPGPRRQRPPRHDAARGRRPTPARRRCSRPARRRPRQMPGPPIGLPSQYFGQRSHGPPDARPRPPPAGSPSASGDAGTSACRCPGRSAGPRLREPARRVDRSTERLSRGRQRLGDRAAVVERGNQQDRPGCGGQRGDPAVKARSRRAVNGSRWP